MVLVFDDGVGFDFKLVFGIWFGVLVSIFGRMFGVLGGYVVIEFEVGCGMMVWIGWIVL